MDNFFYHVPTEIYFGKGQISHLGERMAQLSKKVLLVYGGGSIKRIGLYDEVIAQLKGAGIEYVELSGVEPNPRITSVRRGVELCREHGLTAVLAVGGGKRVGGACAEADSAGAHEVRENHDKVVSHGVDGTLHLLAGACADGNDRNHGRDADDDAERRQKTAHLVAPNRTQRNPEYH